MPVSPAYRLTLETKVLQPPLMTAGKASGKLDLCLSPTGSVSLETLT